jgi:hypothetical protein
MVEFFYLKPAPPRVRRTRQIVLLVAFCAVMAAASGAFASETGTPLERRGLILAMNRPLDSEAAQQFEGVVAHSVRWSLERQKLGVLEKPAPSYEEAAFSNPMDVLDSSIAGEVDFILLTEYASRGQELEIRLSWYDPRSGEKIKEIIRRGRKDLVLDKIIREALNDLLSAVESSLSSLEPREFIPAEGSVAAAQAAATPVAPTPIAGVPNPSATKNAPPLPAAPGGSVESPATSIPAAELNPSQAEPTDGRIRHFEIGVGCAPFVATGAASEYFKLGIMPVLNVSYLFQGKLSRFGLGLYGGMNYFTAAGELTSAQTFLIPVGISLRYEIGSERYPSILFGIASGPALLMMNLNDTLLGLTFFGRGCLGVRLPVGRTFALLIEAGYDVYWEQPNPIMGFSPSVSTTIRL